jgi:hypothetical protein
VAAGSRKQSSAAILTFALDNPLFIALMAGGAIVGLSIGTLPIARPGPSVERWSNLAGVAWLIAFVNRVVGHTVRGPSTV